MKNAEKDARLARLMAHSKAKYGITVLADWRHQEFFDYLQISPSYRLAHLISTGKVKQSEIHTHIPKDFSQVKKVHKAFGDVWLTNFWDWWIEKAQYQFGTKIVPCIHPIAFVNAGIELNEKVLVNAQSALEQYLMSDRSVEGKPASVVLAIPLHQNRKTVMKQFSDALDSAYEKNKNSISTAKYEVIKNKIHQKTLRDAMRIVRAKAALPNKPLYVLGSKVDPKNRYAMKEGQRTLKGDNSKQIMAIVTSRRLNRALTFAENAARGKFPSSDDVECIEFDILEIRSCLISHREWMKAELLRLKALLAKKRNT